LIQNFWQILRIIVGLILCLNLLILVILRNLKTKTQTRGTVARTSESTRVRKSGQFMSRRARRRQERAKTSTAPTTPTTSTNNNNAATDEWEQRRSK
jgi:hypothetical protein